MRRKLFFTLIILVALLGLIASSAHAQSYSFTLTQAIVNVYFNDNGTITIDYIYDFANNPGAPSIEYVDLGLPNSDFYITNVTAEVDGKTITDIEYADPEYLQDTDSGVTLGLGANSIPSGQSGRVHINIAEVRNVFYKGEDENYPDYASFQFSPNWFGSEFVDGTTSMTVSFHLPAAVQPEESVYYPASSAWPGSSEPAASFDDQGRITYTWQSDQARGYVEYIFGAGFPAKYIPAEAIVTKPPIDPGLLICGLVFLGIFAFVGLMIWVGIKAERKRKLEYLPPKISIEGHGIKRGLTAVEAAILMEQPIDKVMTMILFSAIKKGAATVTKRDPLEIQVTDPLPEGLYAYENDFLTAFQQKNSAERRRDLQTTTVNLVKTVSEKMKGFSRKETADYYRNIMEQAWAQVEAADTPEVKGQRYDDVLEWTMLDRRFNDRTQEVFRTGPVYVPTWWGRYDPVFRSSGGGIRPVSTGAPSTGGGSISMPHLPGSDFAASVVNGVQDFSANVIGDLTSFTGGVTNKTNPVPKTTYSSSRTGGGGGGRGCACACACACAGCACACAGGGR